MKLENSFEVPAQPEQVWDLLMDVHRVIPCMPGAKLDEEIDDTTWKATSGSSVWPRSISFCSSGRAPIRSR